MSALSLHIESTDSMILQSAWLAYARLPGTGQLPVQKSGKLLNPSWYLCQCGTQQFSLQWFCEPSLLNVPYTSSMALHSDALTALCYSVSGEEHLMVQDQGQVQKSHVTTVVPTLNIPLQ